jgi:hypothetical protein
MAKAARKLEPVKAPEPLRLDLGCGKNKLAGFTGVDSRAFDGVDIVADLTKPWKWADSSVDEVHCSHFVEHLDVAERHHFVNELYRVLKPGASARIITPHWNSTRAYGDLTHKWPPVCEFWFYYLSREWRALNAPHDDGYTCDLAVTAHYTLRADLAVRSDDYKLFALQNYRDAAEDMVALLVAKK